MRYIRNFVIISHVDHGKSTLADRFLELTGTVEKRKMKEQFLDQMELEIEKGITIKMRPIRMEYKGYILNLIDTPGHVDFSYEVSRSLAAVEGAILLVDATKGIQAQTLANLHIAQEQGLVIIPVINKIDSPLARVDEVEKELSDLLDISEKDIFHISAKDGTNVETLLEEVIEKVPAPKGEEDGFRALIFDSTYDSFKGIIAYVRVVDGKIGENDKIALIKAKGKATVKEVGYFLDKETKAEELKAGEIGYIATGVKDGETVKIGDTIAPNQQAEALAGYEESKPMVFASFYPVDQDEFDSLKVALDQLQLNDPSLVFEVESKEALGRGFRCGFLGLLHSEIIAERIQREFHIELIISRPSVEFHVTDHKDNRISVKTPADWPDQKGIKQMYEPWVKLEVITPVSMFSSVVQLLEGMDGEQKEVQYIGKERMNVIYEVALREIIGDLYDRLKSATQGLASMDYTVIGEREANLVRMEILIAGENEEALAIIVPEDKSLQEGRAILKKLKEVLPAQQFQISLQAAIGGRVISRENIRASRKDVTSGLYGGDITRKRKVLERQKKGKKEMQEKGRVHIPSKVFLEVFRS